jgi:LysM repeat protein
MNKGTKRFLSFALASTLVAGLPAVAHAEGNNNSNGEEATIEETIASSRTYIVQEGDTLGKIAERFYGNAALYEQLAKINNIQNPALIFAGQIITIPRDLTIAYDYQNNEAVVVPAYEEERTYTVKSGDVLDCIVRVLYGSNDRLLVDQFATWNSLSDPNRINVGDVLSVPDIRLLRQIQPNDYTAEYNRMGWILNHPKGCRPCYTVNPYNGWDPNLPIIIPADGCVPYLPPQPCMPQPEQGPCRKLIP